MSRFVTVVAMQEGPRTRLASILACFVAVACSSGVTPPPPPAHEEPVVTRNIPYTSEMSLDVWAPAEEGSFPVVVALHGGFSNKQSLQVLSGAIVAHGIVVFSPSWHSTAPTSKEVILTGYEDAACALRFARRHAAEYQGDPARIIVVGYSAGGALGATITLAGDDFSGDCLVEEGGALADGFVGLEGLYTILDSIPATVLDDMPEDTVKLIDPFDALARQPVREEVEFVLFAGDESEEYVDPSDKFLEALLSKGYSAQLTELTDCSHWEIVHFPRSQIIDAIVNLAYSE